MANDRSSDLDLAERRDEAQFGSASQVSPGAPSGLLARLIRTWPAKPPLVVEAPRAATASRPRPWRPSAYLVSFIVCVVVPALTISLYFAFLASDQFAAEARFAVRSAANDPGAEKTNSSASSFGSVPTTAGQDAFIVAAYIKSRAIIDDLSKSIDLREIFRRPEADLWARLKDKSSVEELTEYWDDMVFAAVDAPTGIVTLRVKAFRRDDALRLANAILAASEALANDISVRVRADAMRMAEREVRSAQGRVLTSLADLRSFRDQVGFIDPTAQASSTGILMTSMLTQKIKLQNDYFVASRAMSPQAPTVQSLKSRLDGLDRQIDEEKAKLTGKSAGTAPIASLLPRFEQLELQNKFSQQLYALAQDGLERARQRAEAQSLYVSVFVPPALPEEARFPERFGLSVVIGLVLLVVWGIGAFTVVVVADHRI